jgi:hypothetical protein
MFWIIRVSELSVHPLPTSTLDNREYICILHIILDFCFPGHVLLISNPFAVIKSGLNTSGMGLFQNLRKS